MALTGAQLLVKCLEKQGVKYIFGIPGAKIDAVFDALVDSSIQVIVCRHEQNAAFMAGAYGRLTGKPGVVLVTSGPGVANLVTGLLTATTEGDPIVAIGGNVERSMALKQSHQSSDNIKIISAASKYCVEVNIPASIPEVVANAFRCATLPRQGAAFISLPQDILLEHTDAPIIEPCTIQFNAAPIEQLQAVADKINQAQLPVLLLGLEASRPENTTAIRQLLKHTKLAVVSTYQAAGVISRELLPCFFGRVGLFKNQPGDQLLDSADLIIAIGFNPIEYDPEIWNPNNKKNIVSIDYIPAQLRLGFTPQHELLGNIAKTLKELMLLLEVNTSLRNFQRIQTLQETLEQQIKGEHKKTESKIHPLDFIQSLRNAINDNTTIISDIGSHYIWLARYLFSYAPHHLLFSNGQQTLGVALPWAIATTLVRPKQQVISISGDGGFLFSAMELETAVRLKANFTHFVWCDGYYDMVLEQQIMKYNRKSAVEFGMLDVMQFAQSFGAHGIRMETVEQLPGILQQAAMNIGPTIVEVPIDYSDNFALFPTLAQHIG